MEHPEWKLIQIQRLIWDTGGNRSQLAFSFAFQRMPEFYENTIVLPTTLICIMALFTFYLPNGRGEKITFSITNFLALVVNLIVMSTNIPNSASGLPVMGQGFFVGLCILGVSVLQSAVVWVVYHSALQPMPVPEVMTPVEVP